ncbi:hypothetical protein [Candidatus Palauibacter sp.]|uniref:hypothetical protein n=1 Tax=Candidatus Palauibacter sp. TaxID=3101350 RepID=UPI003CC5AED2
MRKRALRSKGRALAVSVLLLSPLPAGAQELDAGHLQIHVDGRRVGSERFRVWRAGSTVNAVARIEIVQRPAREVGLQMDPDLLPMQYEVEEGRSVLVSGERFADRVRFQFATAGGEGWKEYMVQEVGAIVEPGVAHHYLLLVRTLREAPEGRLDVLLPLAGRSVPARLTGEGPDSVEIGEGSVAATRYDLEVDGAGLSVWLDADDKLLRVVEPGARREAIRAPVEG